MALRGLCYCGSICGTQLVHLPKVYQSTNVSPKSMWEEIAREVINVLSVEYGVMFQQILAVMHDCASTNTVAMRTLNVLYQSP